MRRGNKLRVEGKRSRVESRPSSLVIHPLLMLLCCSTAAFAQQPTITSKLDTNTILIGAQAKLKISVHHPAGVRLMWPVLSDTLGKLEIVEASKIDTAFSSINNDTVKSQVLKITAFDSGFYVVPPISFFYTVKGDTTKKILETEAMLLTVKTVPVDTSQAIKEIKGPLDVPLTWRDFLPYIIGIILLAGIIFLIWYFIKNRKKKTAEPVRKIPSRPAHEIALEELEKLAAEKLWQQGNFKQYHIRLSDIIRLYIEHRFAIGAMEMTSDEILAAYRPQQGTEQSSEKLNQLLKLADLVKFAKLQPIASENEMSLTNAREFVMITKMGQGTEDEGRVEAKNE